MSNYLIKTKLYFRSPSKEEAQALREELENISCGIVKGFSTKSKEIKEKGEIVDEYQLVTVDLEFASEKYPENLVAVEFKGDSYGEF